MAIPLDRSHQHGQHDFTTNHNAFIMSLYTDDFAHFITGHCHVFQQKSVLRDNEILMMK